MALRHTPFLLALSLLASCESEPVDPTAVSPVASAARAAIDAAPAVMTNADGSAAAVMVSDASLALFPIYGTVQSSLEGWVVANAAMLGLDPVIDGSPPMTLVPDAVTRTDNLEIHRFTQTFKGYPTVGPGESLSVLVVDGYARMVTGTVADERRDYDGERRPMLKPDAHSAIEQAWLDSGGDPIAEIADLELAAMPTWGSLVWKGTVKLGGMSGGGTVIIDAVNGNSSWTNDNRKYSLGDHRDVDVNAHSMTDDPSEDIGVSMDYGLHGSVFGTCDPIPNTNLEQCDLRMGDDRMAVYDAEEDNDLPFRVWTTMALDPFTHQPFAEFNASQIGSHEFETQDIFQKVEAALEVLDGTKAGLGWDHHPDSPFLANEPPPLTVVTNLDGTPEEGESPSCLDLGALGWMDTLKLEPTVQWDGTENMWATDSEVTAVIGICATDGTVALHELGHYLDYYTSRGMLGNDLGSNTCYAGTTDESPAVAETVGDLVSLNLSRALYPQLDYTTSGTAHPCKTTDLGVALGTVHHEDCGIAPGQFYDNYTVHLGEGDDVNPCGYGLGYDQVALSQASWEFVNGKECDEAAPYTCTDVPGTDPGALLEAVTLTLTAGNHWSYAGFYKGIGLVLAYEESYAEGQRFARILEHHGLPIQ